MIAIDVSCFTHKDKIKDIGNCHNYNKIHTFILYFLWILYPIKAYKLNI